MQHRWLSVRGQGITNCIPFPYLQANIFFIFSVNHLNDYRNQQVKKPCLIFTEAVG